MQSVVGVDVVRHAALPLYDRSNRRVMYPLVVDVAVVVAMDVETMDDDVA